MEQTPNKDCPQKIGPWRVVRLIGKGGMAEVYEVEDERLGARYALKRFTYARGEQESARERFFSEGRLLAKLDHPRLVRVYDLAEDEASGCPYFVMDLVLNPEGRPQTLAEVETPDEDRVAMWYEDLREGLAYIHGKGILHRDLKLQNVLVGPDGHAVLSDFGVAKIFNPALRVDLGLSAEQTLIAAKGGRATVMGSVGYMAPEVEMGVAASKESDWYALGVLIFRLLTGVWCDARTDVAGDLETFNPTWLQVIPKLLHLNPAGRSCPSWLELDRARREEEMFKAEQELDRLHLKRHNAIRGRRNGWVAAFLAACVAATLACFVQRAALPDQPPDFDSVVRIPANAPEEESEDEKGMPSRMQLELARIDAWVLTHNLFADLKSGKVSRENAVMVLRQYARQAADDNVPYPMEYMAVGEGAPLAYLLRSAISNLTQKVSQ